MQAVRQEAPSHVAASGFTTERLPWPAAALAIALLALAGWAGFVMLLRLILG